MPTVIIDSTLSVAGNRITDIAAPTDDEDAVNKAYADSLTVGGSAEAGDLLTRFEPVTNGDPINPELVFTGGDIVMAEVPN